MSERTASIEEEIASIGRRADQACTIHSCLRDRYVFRAQLLDYALMAATTYLFALSFIEPVTGWTLTFGQNRTAVVAILSMIAFFLSIVQFKSDWKNIAQAHADAVLEHAAVKSDCRAIKTGTRAATQIELQRIRNRYDMIAETATHIPENQFLKGKAKHVRKVFLSRYLDSHPGALPRLVAFKLFVRDNLGIDLLTNHGTSSESNKSG